MNIDEKIKFLIKENKKLEKECCKNNLIYIRQTFTWICNTDKKIFVFYSKNKRIDNYVSEDLYIRRTNMEEDKKYYRDAAIERYKVLLSIYYLINIIHEK